MDIELLNTIVAGFSLAQMSTEHMPHAFRYRMTNGLKREFAILY